MEKEIVKDKEYLEIGEVGVINGIKVRCSRILCISTSSPCKRCVFDAQKGKPKLCTPRTAPSPCAGHKRADKESVVFVWAGL